MTLKRNPWSCSWVCGQVHSFTVLCFEAVGYSICLHHWKDQHSSCLLFPSNTKDPYLPLILCQFRYTKKVTPGVHTSPCQDSHRNVRALPTGLLNRTSALFILPNLVGQAKSLLPVTMVTASLWPWPNHKWWEVKECRDAASLVSRRDAHTKKVSFLLGRGNTWSGPHLTHTLIAFHINASAVAAQRNAQPACWNATPHSLINHCNGFCFFHFLRHSELSRIIGPIEGPHSFQVVLVQGDNKPVSSSPALALTYRGLTERYYC